MVPLDELDSELLELVYGNSAGKAAPALERNDMESLAKYMKSDECRNIFVLVTPITVYKTH